MRRSVATLVVVNVLVWGLLIPARTFAYAEPSGLKGSELGSVCPPRPADAPEGASTTEVDLVTIGQELADSCYRREQLAAQQHSDLQALDKDLTGTLKTTVEGEPFVKIAGEPTVKIGNWEAAPAGSTVELTPAAKTSVKESSKEASVMLIGSICGAILLWVLWGMFTGRGSNRRDD